MRVGVAGLKLPECQPGPLASVDHAHELGMDSMFFRTALQMNRPGTSGNFGLFATEPKRSASTSKPAWAR